MQGLNIIPPAKKPNSKCWQVFNPLLEGWPGSSIVHKASDLREPSCVWGLGFGNYTITKSIVSSGKKWLFTDMPYFNRWMGEHTAETCYWRLIPNGLHANSIVDYPDDRKKLLGIRAKPWRKQGTHILILPSSDTMTRWVAGMTDEEWISSTVAAVRSKTDRPIKIRKKPRAGKQSGPIVETTPLSNDLRDCWAVVTLASIAGVEAAIEGIPVISHASSATAPISTSLGEIELPNMPDREAWLNTLAYRQFTKAEIRSGLAYSVLHQLL